MIGTDTQTGTALSRFIAGLKSMEPHLRTLGIDPQTILHLGRAKQTLVFQELWAQLGFESPPPSRQLVIRAINGVTAGLFGDHKGVRATLQRFVEGFRARLDDGLPDTALDPSEAPRRVVIPAG